MAGMGEDAEEEEGSMGGGWALSVEDSWAELEEREAELIEATAARCCCWVRAIDTGATDGSD